MKQKKNKINKIMNIVFESFLIILILANVFYAGRLFQIKKDQKEIDTYHDFIVENYIKI